MKLDHYPEDFIKYYHLHKKVDSKNKIYVHVGKGMYSLPQARLVAETLHEKCLNKYRYCFSATTLEFWKHNWLPIGFSLIVDSFGVKYVSKRHADNLLTVFCRFYVVDDHEEGDKYCGLCVRLTAK